MKKQILLMLGTLIILSSINLIIAPGENYHLWDLDKGLTQEPNTLISSIIKDNYDACLCGLTYADVGIFYYYTSFKDYAGLHNYNVPDELLRLAKNDRDRAFAYCWKVHLATDSVSHNYFVPAEIEKTKLPNDIIHPIKELKIEGNYLDPRSNHMMEIHAEFDDLVKQATGKDWSPEAIKLNTIIGGGNFYSEAYAPDTSTFWGRSQNYLYKIIAPLIDDKSAVDMEKLTVEETAKVLRGETPAGDPSGEAALKAADKSTQLWLFGLTFLFIIIVTYLGFRWRLFGFSKERFKFR